MSSNRSFDFVTARRALVALYQSDDNVPLHRRVWASLMFGALSLPQARFSRCSRLQSDIGLRARFAALWFGSYHPEALSLALDVVFGHQASRKVARSVHVHSKFSCDLRISRTKAEGIALKTLLDRRGLIEDDTVLADLESSSGLQSWRKTLLRSLMTVVVLNHLETADLFPTLWFRATSYRSSKAVLTALGKLLLPSVRNI